MMQIRNAQHNGQGGIDCEIEHPQFGWIPFTARADDIEELGKQVFAAAEPIAAPYVAPEIDAAELLEAERATMVCRSFGLKVALHNAGLLTQASSFMETADTIVQLAWENENEFRRNSPTINAIANGLQLTPEQVDDLFRAAIVIEA